MRWMDIKPMFLVKRVSQKEEDKYRILMPIRRTYKNGTEELIYRAAMEKQT